MGITGLIPFLEKASRQANVSEFSGKTVAVDTYCWLHKGAFSCADKLVMGLATDAYVKYCMKFVQMLLSNKIKPILVFDGRHLPAKAETEIKRRESRDSNRKRAADCLKMGKISEGKSLLKRSLDVSHKMALEVIKECQAHNIDCIVAPYEADAQLAYLNLSGIADVVITEDSDLTLFGCKKILFKMDIVGNGLLVEQERLHLSMGLRRDEFSMDKFIYMCILSGCDYLPSLSGIGLNNACKFIVKTTSDDIYNALTRMPSTLNKKNLVVTREYRDSFMRALVTFKHQLVFCPIQRKQVRLNPVTSNVTAEQLTHAGSEVDAQLAWQLALGNCDPFTCEKLNDFDPDKVRRVRTNAWSETAVAKHVSMWSKDFKVKSKEDEKPVVSPRKVKQLPTRLISTRGQVVTMKTDSLRKEITPKKRSFEESELSADAIFQLYKRPDAKPVRKLEVAKVEAEVVAEQTSPILARRSNPFKKLDDPNETSPSLLHRSRRRLVGRFKPTVIDHTAVSQSRFFAEDQPKPAEKKEEEGLEPMEVAEDEVADSMEVNVDSQDFKENVDRRVGEGVVIPETEPSDDEMMSNEQENVNKDSGFKEDRNGKHNGHASVGCVVAIEKEPLVDNKMRQNAGESRRELRSKEQKNSLVLSEAVDDVQFSITREIFSEFKSSLFAYESPDKRPRRDNGYSVPSSQKSSTFLQRSTSKRAVKNTAKKSTIIQGQQSLLNMFSFQKKNSLHH